MTRILLILAAAESLGSFLGNHSLSRLASCGEIAWASSGRQGAI